jgi:hypothetical protein
MNLGLLCLKTAVVLGLVGFTMGLFMGVTHDFTLAPAHAHMNLLGWVSFFLYGGFYLLVPAAAQGLVPRIHYALASLGTVVMVGGIAGIYLGNPEVYVPVAIAGSVAVYLSFALFAFIVLRARLAMPARSAETSAAEAPRRPAEAWG